MQLLRVMSFNVQTELPEDALCRQNRLWAVAEEVKSYAPDLLGTQEDNQSWTEYLSDPDHLPGYGAIANHFDEWKPERCAIYYNKATLTLVESGFCELTRDGTFGSAAVRWEQIPKEMKAALDLTPERIMPDVRYPIPFADGSGYQEVSILTNRRMTWGVFEDREGERVLYVNTHLQHRSQNRPIAKNNPAYLALREMERLAQWDILQAKVTALKEIYGDLPVIITGDMNERPGSRSYRYFTATGEFAGEGIAYEDASLTCQVRTGNRATFNAAFGKTLAGVPMDPASIPANTTDTVLDYCFLSPGRFRVERFHVGDCRANTSKGVLFSSDHYPIVIDLHC